MKLKQFFTLTLAAVVTIGSLFGGSVLVKADDIVIEKDIPILKDSFEEKLGEGTYAGVALTNDEIYDENLMALVTTHFNAVTFGNELKPDALFGYSNSKHPELITYDFNGEEFEAPKMDFSRAERMLDYFAKWNAENPDRPIKIRGHVLVWHSQTPEWFFHENWDKKEPYVSKKEMDKRQEWYIKEVLEHFTTKYENMFYGWDVVNEAISDATGTYRSDTENGGESLNNDTHGSNSSWWKVYQSEEYIINAFKYANKYAPDYVELYYNDYNECTPLKSNGIITLLETVKAAEGTRIDGMGLQGHYNMDTPTGGQVKIAAKRYADVVGNVSLTELDLKASSAFDGTEEGNAKEYRKQYYKYKEIYQGLKELKDDGVTLRTITVWGVIDGHSWLQSQNNVGGGSNGKQKQCPLLFDDDYKAKPLFYALCGEDMPEIKKTEEPAEEIAEEVSDDTIEEATDADGDVTEVADTVDASETSVTEQEEASDTTESSNTSGRSGVPIAVLACACLAIGCGVYARNKRKK